MGLIMMTSEISIYGHKGESYVLVGVDRISIYGNEGESYILVSELE